MDKPKNRSPKKKKAEKKEKKKSFTIHGYGTVHHLNIYV